LWAKAATERGALEALQTDVVEKDCIIPSIIFSVINPGEGTLSEPVELGGGGHGVNSANMRLD
jgi:hypothetical protein